MKFLPDIGLQLMITHRRLNHLILQHIKDHEIAAHYQIIMALYRLGERSSQIGLCQYLKIAASNLSVSVEHLEAQGYITRYVNSQNRRTKILMPTAKAKKFMEHLQASFDALEDPLFKDIDDDDRYKLLGLLVRLNEHINEMACKHI